MTNKQLNIEVKPCPFCGGKPLIKRDHDVGSLSIECPNCSKAWNDDEKPSDRWASDFGFCGWDESSDAAVIAAWNQRAVIRSTCRNVSGYKDTFECSECHCKAELTSEVCNEHGEPFSVYFIPAYCPNCGAEVVDDA